MIRVEPLGAVTLLALSRPDRRNALTPAMLDDLPAQAERAARAGARAIVLAGDGPVFCSGFDLALCRDHPDGSVMRDLLAGLSRAVRGLRRVPVPVVGAARGAAIAGGCALLGGCDVVVTDSGAKLGYPVVRLGVSPAVSAPFLRAAVGDGPCRARQLDPGLIDGREAVRLGLAHEVVAEASAVLPRAAAIAAELAAKPTGAVSATRAWLNELDGTGGDATPDLALAASLALAGGEEERSLLPAAWSR